MRAARKEPRETAVRVTCGWCNRIIGQEPGTGTRHVTCSECRDLFPKQAERVA
jgi:hypothetical protein